MLFCRINPKVKNITQPFIYCGKLEYIDYFEKTTKPVHIVFNSKDFDESTKNINLKEIYKRRVSKNRSHERWDSSDRKWGKANFGGLSTRYGGQFHTDVIGLWNRNILVLNGANGQQIVIDMDNSRIVVINSGKSNNYDSYKLGFEPIKFGRIR